MNESQQNNIPEPIRSWCDRLTRALGDQLVSVVLFGGLAKGEFVPDQSDVNVAVVFHAITPEVLERAAPLLRDGTREFRLSALLLTAGELRDSADVFPVKFLDLQRRHKVLWGGDPFAQLAINRDHLRLRCEQELRNLLLRLRQSYVQRLHRPELLESALNRAVSSLLVNLGVLVELKTGQPVNSKQDALAGAAQLDLALEPVQQAWALKLGTIKPDAAALKQLFAAFMGSVQQAADLADKLA